jgi:N-acetylglucosaminyldiphosphoundecaprenol N-acetyl-beta-D-mannosaminyltransferase
MPERAETIGRAVEPKAVPRITLGGLPIAVIDRPRSAALMVEWALARRGTGEAPLYVTSANGQVLSLCAKRPEIAALFRAADLIHADGQPLVLASRLVSPTPLPERVATTDLFRDVAAEAVARDASFYLLGADRVAIEKAAASVRRRFRISGSPAGGTAISKGRPRKPRRSTRSTRRGPTSCGSAWGRRASSFSSRRTACAHVGLVKTSGGLFDFLSGRNSRAPRWMQDAGLEWLYRTALEPRRLLLRYAVTNPHAAYLLLTQSS